MIQAHNLTGNYNEALKLFKEMKNIGIEQNEYTYSIIFQVLTETNDHEESKRVLLQLQV